MIIYASIFEPLSKPTDDSPAAETSGCFRTKSRVDIGMAFTHYDSLIAREWLRRSAETAICGNPNLLRISRVL